VLESLTLLEMHLFFQVVHPCQVVRFGMKTWELCDTAVGYLWSLYMQARTQNLIPSLSQLSTSRTVPINQKQ
jgi:hypothetical protein